MAWKIEFTPRAQRAVTKLDRGHQRRILDYLQEVSQLDDPRSRGKALASSLSGLWRWRVGDYRVVAEINDGTLIVVIVDVGHRSDIYRK
ncbi:type II toxin-antitoxin system RelE/ParE family toxin [Corynebacterium sp. TA-R-1]|uniref:Type II toxin-antitoxin system RelE/ParE family toxin n=1 Tax=Corynebacterium stercoris TaxID=2943490 RepID=A0ABT1G1D7_9CORY|nr:type II toxin-antitoxin system RelE/ParE family toxin [Corynebacterium stercoris]MCP1386778.1 type II toxin-antitoxin system RelE/ParE family toxin [Corynebacterium stercoris]